jgi:hypothetical protein
MLIVVHPAHRQSKAQWIHYVTGLSYEPDTFCVLPGPANRCAGRRRVHDVSLIVGQTFHMQRNIVVDSYLIWPP